MEKQTDTKTNADSAVISKAYVFSLTDEKQAKLYS
jgi:hypothetical protein